MSRRDPRASHATAISRNSPMRVWFITGASRGFGALVAQRALDRGDAVVATARNPKAIVDRIGAHPDLLALALDVTRESEAVAAAQAAIDRFGSDRKSTRL